MQIKSSLVFPILSLVRGIGRKTLLSISEATVKATDTEEALFNLYLQLVEPNKRIERMSFDIFRTVIEKGRLLDKKNEELGILTIDRYSKYYPKNFVSIPDPPAVFYAKGNVECLNQSGIAVIGTRNISDYGKLVGEKLGRLVAKSGNMVISGLAVGCDIVVHIGCLKAGGTTVAILPSPLDKVFPAENSMWADVIADCGGCVISEYPLGTKMTNGNFVERDRLQCGLADGVIVIETSINGGTMHAVNGAFELGKPVACLDYQQEHYDRKTYSRGNRELIRSGKAVPLPAGGFWPLPEEDRVAEFIKSCNKS